MKKLFLALPSFSLKDFLCLLLFLVCFQAQSDEIKNEAAGAERVQNGVKLQADELNLRVQFYANSTVRVLKWSSAGVPPRAPDLTSLPDHGKEPTDAWPEKV
jgi:hypothetical protein